MTQRQRAEGDNVRERTFVVDQNFVGWRLDAYLSRCIPRLSRSKAARIARYGDVTLEPERPVKPSTKMRYGDRLILREALAAERLQDDEVRWLYDEDDLIVLDKPAGMLVHESATARLNTVVMYFERLALEEAEPVHRLDRETSGVLVCARRRELVAPLRAIFASDHPDKIYRALVDDPEERWQPAQRASLRQPLGLQADSVTGVLMGPGSLEATTHVHVLGRRGNWADLEVRIETGRQHQIRVHLAMAHTPIVGDKLYGLGEAFYQAYLRAPDEDALLAQLPLPRHALHAWRLNLRHPRTGRKLELEAPLPAIWTGSET